MFLILPIIVDLFVNRIEQYHEILKSSSFYLNIR